MKEIERQISSNSLNGSREMTDQFKVVDDVMSWWGVLLVVGVGLAIAWVGCRIFISTKSEMDLEKLAANDPWRRSQRAETG